jgi:hypothetical protein
LLPTLSRLSVSYGPGDCLRYWCSSRYLRISPLHREFHPPLPYSSQIVSNGLPRLSRGLSRSTYLAAYTRFTPSDSEQRLHPTFYRGCWHVVGRCLLRRYRQTIAGLSSLPTGFYDPKASITHAASLRQAFAHCAKFLTAASRRSLGRVSVPVWLTTLSGQLPVFALVGRYPTNKLIGRGPILRRVSPIPAGIPACRLTRY